MTIYQASIFADKKARQVGDLLTILVIERASASREAKTKTSRTSGRNGKLGALVGLPTRGLGATGNVLPEGISLSSASNFDGLGSTEQSDALDATVSVIVTEVFHRNHRSYRGNEIFVALFFGRMIYLIQ